PNITTSLADRVSLASSAVEKAISMLGSDGQFDGEQYDAPGILYSQMAELDIATNQTKYQDSLEQYFPLAQNSRANFSDELGYGYAAVRAYAAYKNPVFLQYAVQSWWFGRTYTLSPDDIDAGKIAGKNFTVEQFCQGITMAGGTFFVCLCVVPILAELILLSD
ncbi:hypothetical protein C8R44DRAFT_627179, partial [Mycena epipterygia]